MMADTSIPHEHWITLCNECGVILEHCDCMAEAADVYLSFRDVSCDACEKKKGEE